jgi:hypothetical protein
MEDINMPVMTVVTILILLLALVFIGIHAFGVRNNTYHFGWLGAMFYVIYVILTVVVGVGVR